MNRWGFGGKKYNHRAGELPLTREGDVRFYPQVKLAGWLRSSAGRACKAVAFPQLIGCGLAGGDWTVYERMITVELIRLLPADVDVYVVEYDSKTEATVAGDLEAASAAWRDAHPPISLMMSGSRTWMRPIAPLLDQFVAHVGPDRFHLTHGDAAGADRMCSDAAKARNWTTTSHAFQGRLHGHQAGVRGKTRTRLQALLVFPLPPHQMKSRLPLAARNTSGASSSAFPCASSGAYTFWGYGGKRGANEPSARTRSGSS
jgi:hypothetical protein